jgi:hypothetical protein
MMHSNWVLVVLLFICDSVLGVSQKLSLENNTNNESLLQNALPDSQSLHKINLTRDESHPLLKVLETAPHSMSLRIKPLDFQPDTMIRLLYERVSLNKGPFMLHLDDPVIEYIPLIRRVQTHTLSELPMGKYIVCGEAMVMGEVYQASCFQTNINRLDNNSKLVEINILSS